MNRPVRRVAAAFGVLLLLLMVNVSWLQVGRAGSLREHPSNARKLLEEYSRERGAIVVGDQAIVVSEETEDQLKYLRVYREGQLYAPATGYYSHVVGASGIEQFENGILAGSDDRLFVRRVLDLLTGKPPLGGSVKLTLDPKAQQAAFHGLDGRRGAVAAIEPKTGRILALVSSPSYNPNRLASHSSKKVQSAWDQLNEEKNKPLLNRAANETYAPGSTFKLVTAAAALSAGIGPNDSVPGPARLDLPGTQQDLPNYFSGGCTPGSNTTTMTQALKRSCNTTFGALAMQLGEDAMRAQAEAFGWNAVHDIPMPSASSRFAQDMHAAELAKSGIGQQDVTASPLQMAMVVAGIANRGVVMKPYLVDELSAPDLAVLDQTVPERLSKAVEPSVARMLTEMMVGVVEEGTGSNARIRGVDVAGKTGTAQLGGGRNPHAWFVAFAPADNPEIAVAVVLENGGSDRRLEVSGNQLAAPIAREVMEAVLR